MADGWQINRNHYSWTKQFLLELIEPRSLEGSLCLFGLLHSSDTWQWRNVNKPQCFGVMHEILNETAIWSHVYWMDAPKICTHFDHQPPKAISSFVIFVPFHLCHVFSTSSFCSSNFFFYSFFWIIGLKSQWANIIMNKKLSVCGNIPERAKTTHHHHNQHAHKQDKTTQQ